MSIPGQPSCPGRTAIPAVTKNQRRLPRLRRPDRGAIAPSGLQAVLHIAQIDHLIDQPDARDDDEDGDDEEQDVVAAAGAVIFFIVGPVGIGHGPVFVALRPND